MDLIVLGLNFQVVKYYTDEEIEMFRAIVERGLPSFYRWARQGGILSAWYTRNFTVIKFIFGQMRIMSLFIYTFQKERQHKTQSKK